MRSYPARRSSHGFTLVELMVAVTGGLFVAIAVFMLARDGSRFYQHESRVADATVAAMVGFGRLQADIGRAGFLSSPNLRRDPSHCEREANPAGWAAGWPTVLANLASVRIASTTGLPQVLADNQRSPDTIVVAASLSSADEFPTAGFDLTGGQLGVVLQTKVGPLPRLGYLGITDSNARLAMLGRLFPPSRALRIVDQSGMTHYGVIASVGFSNLGDPRIQLQSPPTPLFRTQNPYRCALTGVDTMGRVSVVNIVRYELRHVDGTTNPEFGPLFANTATTEMGAWEQGRTELVREELRADSDLPGEAIANTTEIVAEYAVDLKFGLTAVTAVTGTEPTQLASYAEGDATNIKRFAADLASTPTATPELIRALRVRLSVRSAVPDRANGIVGGTGTPIPQGAFFRMNLGSNRFARVRTLQTDVALPNHAGIAW
jgi:hypothetical protein